MQKTHDFKVGDIVRFKSEHEHYANRWSLPITNLKISKIIKEFYEDRIVSLLFVEGRDGYVTSGVYDFRVELETSGKPNMFAFGKKNPKIKKVFLDYIEGYRRSGLCWHTESESNKAYDFLKSQKVFEVNADTPVEYFILRSKKKSTKNAWYNYTNTCSFNDPSTPEGRLRIWWATNLAIAASQGKI